MNLSDLSRRHAFEPVPADRLADHLPAAVLRALPPAGWLAFPVDDAHSDTQAFSERYAFGLEDCANTLILRYSRDQGEHHAAVVSLGSRRLDVNGAVKRALGAGRISFAKREVATELTGMEFGGITAFGLPPGWRILVDAAVMARPYVVVGAGLRRTKLLLEPALLAGLPGAEVAELA